jgi:hypothetical protein
MLVASQLVFVHVPRTGGVFVKEVLAEHLRLDEDAPRLPTHASYDELAARFRDRPAFCVVRNPWDWYVSWYHHSISRGPKVARLDPSDPKRVNWEGLFEGGRSTFKETVSRMCHGQLVHPFASEARRRDVDLYSEYVRVLAGRAIEEDRVEPGRFEELVPFLVDFLDRQQLLSDSLRDAIEGSPATNTSEHGPYRGYYDDDLRDLVSHKARPVIERFGYSF